ncbi:MAG: cell division protein ZapC [Gammaproteobacteria bacterium]|nr:cell division protein ZapC [Gammaproteobacteria bacterium]
MQHAWIHWFWQINQDSQRLELWLSDDICFATSLTSQQLNTAFNEKVPFNAEDAELYTAFRDILCQTNLDQQAQFSVAINAAVSCNYLTPLASKSWYFQAIGSNEQEFFGGDFVQVQSQRQSKLNECSLYMIIEPEQQASTAVLVSESQLIDEHRVLRRGQIIKAHNDRFKKVPKA